MDAQRQGGAEVDERFEFDAPRFYDFNTMTSDCSPADAWFETAPEGPGQRPAAANEGTREPFKNLQTAGDKAGAQQQAGPSGTQQQKDKGKQPAEAGGSEQLKKPTGNIVTSWGDIPRGGLKRTRAQADQEAAAGPSTAAAGAAAAASAGAGAAGTAGAAGIAGAGSQKARRVSTAQSAPRSEPPVTRSMTRMQRQAFTPIPERKAKHFSPPKTRNARTAAKPRTPSHKRSVRDVRDSSARLRQVLEAKITKPSRSTKPLTLPEDVQLQTSKRAGRGGKAAEQAPAASPFRSLAEKVLEFQSKTPPRFRVPPKGATTRPASAGASRGRAGPQQPQITEAKEPVLWTSTRARPRRFKTREEEEEEEMQREKEAAFHARPVDPAVLTGAMAAPRPKSADKFQPTEPKPFSFAVDKRAESRRGRASVADGAGEGLQRSGAGGFGEAGGPQTRLRAGQMAGGRSILDGGSFTFGAKAPSRPTSAGHQRPASAGRSRPSLTVPKSPLLRTKTRHHSPVQQRELPKVEFKARPAPSFDMAGAKSVPFVAPKEVTQPQPFRLATDGRHKQHEASQQAKLEAQRRMEERLRRTSARPLPLTTDMPAVPPKPQPKDLTLPMPYRLRSEVRHADAVQQYQEQLQREEEERRRAAEFKARPMWAGKPFTVHESDAPLTVPDDVHLATEDRAEDREEFDKAVAEKIKAQEEEKRRQEELKRQREEEEAREYRKQLKFKARPMPKFDQPFFSQPSDKPLTNPQTPKVLKRSRKE